MAKVYSTIVVPIVGIKMNDEGNVLIKESSKGSFYYQLESNAPKFVRTSLGKKRNDDSIVCQFFDTESEALEEARLDLEFLENLAEGEVWNVEVTKVTEVESEDEV